VRETHVGATTGSAVASLRIFLGSSTEALPQAKVLQDILFEESDASVLSWWSEDAFPVSKTFVESIAANAAATNASIILATPDDQRTSRGAQSFVARDNVIFEHGVFSGAHGRDRAALATVGHPTLPTDLLGVAVLRLQACPTLAEFKERNRSRLRAWTQQVSKASGTAPPVLGSFSALDGSILIDGGRLTYLDVQAGLAALIEDARMFAPDCVVGINRGGAIVGGCIAKQLGIGKLSLLSVNCDLKPVVTEHRSARLPLTGRILLVDDALRKGEHMRASVRAASD
jgi:hypothetical protein